MEISLSDVLTPVGFVTTAALVTGLVEVLKLLLPGIGTRNLEQILAAVVTALLVVAAVAVRVEETPLGSLGDTLGLIVTAVAAWYGILRIALGIHDDATAAPNSLTGPTGAG